jgi:hypothetical protein
MHYVSREENQMRAGLSKMPSVREVATSLQRVCVFAKCFPNPLLSQYRNPTSNQLSGAPQLNRNTETFDDRLWSTGSDERVLANNTEKPHLFKSEQQLGGHQIHQHSLNNDRNVLSKFHPPQQQDQQLSSDFSATGVLNQDWKDITSSSREAYSFSGPDDILADIPDPICQNCAIPFYQCIHGVVSFTQLISWCLLTNLHRHKRHTMMPEFSRPSHNPPNSNWLERLKIPHRPGHTQPAHQPDLTLQLHISVSLTLIAA